MQGVHLSEHLFLLLSAELLYQVVLLFARVGAISPFCWSRCSFASRRSCDANLELVRNLARSCFGKRPKRGIQFFRPAFVTISAFVRSLLTFPAESVRFQSHALHWHLFLIAVFCAIDRVHLGLGYSERLLVEVEAI